MSGGTLCTSAECPGGHSARGDNPPSHTGTEGLKVFQPCVILYNDTTISNQLPNTVICLFRNIYIILYILYYTQQYRISRFAQYRDCPAQTLDPWFVVQIMDWPRNPWIAHAQSMDQDNPGIALRKA